MDPNQLANRIVLQGFALPPLHGRRWRPIRQLSLVYSHLLHPCAPLQPFSFSPLSRPEAGERRLPRFPVLLADRCCWWSQAADGFCRKNGVAVADLVVRPDGGPHTPCALVPASQACLVECMST